MAAKGCEVCWNCRKHMACTCVWAGAYGSTSVTMERPPGPETAVRMEGARKRTLR